MNRRRAGIPLLIVAFTALASCAAVPLSTIIRMSTFDERDFAKLEPEVLRVRIKLPEGFGLDVGRSWLGVEIGSAAGVHDARFELDEELAHTALLPGSLFAAPRRGTEYVLRLSEPSSAKFRELQAFVSRGRTEQIGIRVVPRLSAAPADASAVSVWIDILLSEAEGYFTLVDGATIGLGSGSASGVRSE